MIVEEYLNNIVDKEGAAHLTLIDPDSQTPEKASEIAVQAMQGGTDAIMVGGSTSVGSAVLDQTVLEIKKNTSLPIILFPSSASGLSKHADAIFFMSLLNSRNVDFITTFQALGAPLVLQYGIEPISMAYIIIEPGGTAGWISDAKCIPRTKPEIAVAYSLAGKYLGMHYIYLEAGSGADQPVPAKMISLVKKAVQDRKLIVGGGIGSASTAKKCVNAGADMIVTGTAIEGRVDVRSKIEEIVNAIKF
ncbi:MAG: geranylgeranylglyceryl/heptaprenylglyceryl phosphate synthase [Methanosarcinales archaeon]